MAEIREFTFPSSTGKNTIFAREYLPEGEPRGIVQIAHGIAEHIGRYDGFMNFLAKNGFIAVGNDHLGHGKSAPNESERGIFAETDGWARVVDDIDALHDRISAEHPDLPYIFFGHSMGSFLTRTYIILHPEKPSLAILCGTGNQPRPLVAAGNLIAGASVKLGGADKPGDMMNNIAFGSYNNGYEEVRTDFDWISSDPAAVDTYIADPDCGFVPKTSMFRDMLGGVGFITDPNNLTKMNKELPVLFISGWADPVGENGKGVKRAYKAFLDAGMRHVHIKLYPNARHELLNETIKADVMADILEWISQKLGN